MKAVRAPAMTPHQHEFEAAPGLPETLPSDERILWQGAPDAGQLARRVFHLPKVAAYFAVLIGLQAMHLAEQIGPTGELLLALVPALALATLGLGLLGLWCWMTARTTLYTLTNRRVVMRIGIVLTLTLNLPLRVLAGASVRELPKGYGDLPLALPDNARIAWLHLWPHARPWAYARAQPTLRCIPQVAAVAAQLTEAWRAAALADPAQRAAAAAAPALRPEPESSPLGGVFAGQRS